MLYLLFIGFFLTKSLPLNYHVRGSFFQSVKPPSPITVNLMALQARLTIKMEWSDL